MMQFRYFVITLTALLGFSGSLNAAGPGGDIGGGSCSVASYNALMNFNYDSGFPLRIMANITVSGSDVSYPPGATNQSICKCGKIYGYTRGMWLPTRFVEVVRRADCSPVYGASVRPMLRQMAQLSGTLQPVTLQTAVTTPPSDISTAGSSRSTPTAGVRAASIRAAIWKRPLPSRPGRAKIRCS